MSAGRSLSGSAAVATVVPAGARRELAGVWLWLGVLAVFAALVTAYVVAFRAANTAQIKDVPLATSGGHH